MEPEDGGKISFQNVCIRHIPYYG